MQHELYRRCHSSTRRHPSIPGELSVRACFDLVYPRERPRVKLGPYPRTPVKARTSRHACMYHSEAKRFGRGFLNQRAGSWHLVFRRLTCGYTSSSVIILWKQKTPELRAFCSRYLHSTVGATVGEVGRAGTRPRQALHRPPGPVQRSATPLKMRVKWIWDLNILPPRTTSKDLHPQ